MIQFKNVLCLVEPKTTSNTAIIQAIKIANDHQADISFISVLEDTKPWGTALGSKVEYQKCLGELADSTRSVILDHIKVIAPLMNPNIRVISGIGFIEIIKTVVDQQYDLLVKCAENLDWVDRMFGSEDMHLLRKCPCPVLILEPEQKDHFRNILATVDVNDYSDTLDNGRIQDQLNQQVLRYSAAISVSELIELHIGSAWEACNEHLFRYGVFTRMSPEKVNEYVEQVRRQCSIKLGKLAEDMSDYLGEVAIEHLQPKFHLVKGAPSREIPIMIKNYNADLIVMGTVGRVGIPGLIIGNTAEAILEQTKCSVLAIKPESFKTPVV